MRKRRLTLDRERLTQNSLEGGSFVDGLNTWDECLKSVIGIISAATHTSRDPATTCNLDVCTTTTCVSTNPYGELC